jgi:pimeloyl-ACP methyl ester carboxylesterase
LKNGQPLHAAVVLLWILLAILIVIALLVLVSALVLWSNKRHLPPKFEFVEVRGTKLHYYQKGSGRPLVMVHGSNGSLNDFRLSVIDELSKDFRVLAFDRPGHGYSERPPGKQESCAIHGDLIREAWKKLGVDKPIVMGHSSAGAVLMDMAVRSPEDLSALVILSGVVHSFEGQQVPIMGLFRALKRKYVGTVLLWTLLLPIGGLVGRWLLKFTFDPDPIPEIYRKVGVALALRPSSLRAEAEDLECVSATLKAVEGRYGEIKLPIVLVVGEKDKNVPQETQCIKLHSEIAHSELVMLENTGHMSMFTRSVEVARAVRRADELSR